MPDGFSKCQPLKKPARSFAIDSELLAQALDPDDEVAAVLSDACWRL
jgi:hypothetical protein